MNIKQYTLDVVNEVVTTRLSSFELALSMDAKVLADKVADELILKLTSKRARQFLGSVTIKQPTTWWQHFKESHFPPALLKRFPVKYKTTVVSAEAFYDKMAIPDEVTEFRVYAAEGKLI